ncbi:MAG: sugar kinase [Anaerolinea sp.]|nr:sugar kinase [Anaerolinea sp.]
MTHIQSPVLALDFGGTKLAAAVVDIATGEIRSIVRHLTPSHQGANPSIQKMFEIGHQVLEDCNFKLPMRVGISFGGPVTLDRRNVLMSNHVPDWEGIPLPQLAEEEFGCPAWMDNDANLAALGSWIFDANRSPDQMVYLQISTGIGAGLILNRKLYRGSSLAGEIGHVTIIPDGPLCNCGKRGCLESLSAGWALARAGRDVLKLSTSEDLLYKMAHGKPENIDAQMLLEAANKGDMRAYNAVRDAFTALGIAISTMITLFDPQVFILGGGVTRAEAQMRSIIQPVIQKELHPLFMNRCQLLFSKLEGKETILGAAYLED